MIQRPMVIAWLLCSGMFEHIFGADRRIIAQKTILIQNAINLPPVLTNIIVGYAPTIPPRPIPLCFDGDDEYQRSDTVEYDSFILFEPEGQILKERRFRVGPHKPCRFLGSHCELTIKNDKDKIVCMYGDEMVEYMCKNLQDRSSSCNIEIAADMVSVGEQTFCELHGISPHVVKHLTCMMNCGIQSAARDSDIYQRAQQRTPFMLRGDVTWRQLGICMDKLYKKFGRSDVQYQRDYWIRKYMQAYDKSHVPCWLKKIKDDSNLEPVFYKKAQQQPQPSIPTASQRKRKRIVQ